MVLIHNGSSNGRRIVPETRDSGMWLVRGAFNPHKTKKARRSEARRFRKHIPYEIYMRSDLWRKRRRRYFATHPKQCTICRYTKGLHLHHIVYSTRGHEKDKHLAILCTPHHNEFHEKHGSKGDMTLEWQLYLNDCKS